LNGYTISSGIISNKLNDDKIVAIPWDVDDSMTLGWLKHQLEVYSFLQRNKKSRFMALLCSGTHRSCPGCVQFDCTSLQGPEE